MSKMIQCAVWAGCLLAVSLSAPPASAADQDEAGAPTDGAAAPSVEDILTREPDAEDYAEEERCIQTRRIRRTEVLDEKHIVLHMGRDEYYMIQFDHRCPGLRPKQAVIFENSMSNRLCSLDGIRGTYNNGLGGYSTGPRCSVPGFQPVTKEQVVLLKDTLKLEARKAREERKASKRAEREARRQEKALQKAAEQADAAEAAERGS